MMDKPRRIIFAEDEPASRALLSRQLESAGYDTIACANGQEALDAIRAEGSGIVVADWMMPKLDGLELCAIVRELGAMKTLGSVYFILLTANSDKESIVRGLDAGADDYLTKPYHPKELLARIRAGVRIMELQEQAVRSQIEVYKVNAQLAVLNQKLDRLANTDVLTGLANRRRLFERFSEAWSLAQRKERALSCIMLDVDRFKRVNDDFGHKAGDIVLQQIAGVLKRHARQYDICGRFGGEEFLIVCPETELAGAAALAERVRLAVAELAIEADGGTIRPTISAGAAQMDAGHETTDAVIAAADAMLYRAKESGRNQVWGVDQHGHAEPFLSLVAAS